MRYNLVSPRPRKDGKTHWHNIGSAFTRDKGGFSLVFDSLPLPDAEGRVTVLMTEPLPDRDAPRDDARQSAGAGQGGASEGFRGSGQRERASGAVARGNGPGRGDDMDDQIPFSMEWRL